MMDPLTRDERAELEYLRRMVDEKFGVDDLHALVIVDGDDEDLPSYKAIWTDGDGTSVKLRLPAGMEAWLKNALAQKKREAIRAAVELLMDEVNSSTGEKDAIKEVLGKTHTFLLNEFVWLVLQAVRDYKSHGDKPEDFDGRIASPPLREFLVAYVPRKAR